MRCAELVEIRRRDLRSIGLLDDSARILARDSATVTGVKSDRDPNGRRIGYVCFRLNARCALYPRVCRLDIVVYIEPKVVDAQSPIEVQSPVIKIDSLLQIAGRTRHVGMRARGYVESFSFLGMKEANIDLIVVKIRAHRQQRGMSKQFPGMEILD